VNAWRDQIVSKIDRLGIRASVSIDSTGEGRIIVISAEPGTSLPTNVLEGIPEDRVVVDENGTTQPAGNPQDQHAGGSQMAGLSVDLDPGGSCTWGISGNNDIDHYMFMAGHCGNPPFEQFTGWTNVLEVDQANQFHLTSNWRYVISEFNNSTIDRKGVSSDYANDNCYHWGHCAKIVTNRALHNSWEINSDMTCASLGSSNVWRCGLIREENYTGGGDCGGPGGWLRVQMAVVLGDSGAGAIYPYSGAQSTFDGILGCRKGSGESIWTTAFLFKAGTNLDANCWGSAVSFYSPSSWGTCPAIDR